MENAFEQNEFTEVLNELGDEAIEKMETISPIEVSMEEFEKVASKHPLDHLSFTGTEKVEVVVKCCYNLKVGAV